MAYLNLGGPDTAASEFAQIGAAVGPALAVTGAIFDIWWLIPLVALGPLVPYLVWTNRRDEEQFSARDAAVATNFAGLVLVIFLAGTGLRMFVPVIGWLGAIVQVGVGLAAVVLSIQAFASVRSRTPAQYPAGIPIVRL